MQSPSFQTEMFKVFAPRQQLRQVLDESRIDPKPRNGVRQRLLRRHNLVKLREGSLFPRETLGAEGEVGAVEPTEGDRLPLRGEESEGEAEVLALRRGREGKDGEGENRVEEVVRQFLRM